MQHIDLEPHEYTERGKKEPILNKGWWLTLLIVIGSIVFGQVAIRPVVQAAHAFMMDYRLR